MPEVSWMIGFIAAIALTAVAAVYFAVTTRQLAQRLAERDSEGQLTATRLQDAVDAARRETGQALAETIRHLADRTAAETKLDEARRQIGELLAERQAARDDAVAAERARVDSDRRAALAEQARHEMERRITDWEQAKAESQQAAQAAALQTISQMSSKLIEDHKRETEATKLQQAEQIKTTTEGLFGQVQRLASAVDSLSGQVNDSRGRIDLVHRALASPGGAGYFAEIGLENTLKAFGLTPGRDFIMQYSMPGQGEGRGLRPDAVVFLPGQSVLVIDAKASKFLLELAAADGGEEEEAAARAALARSMNQHLKDLAGRDYEAAIRALYAKSSEQNLRRVINVMYLPNEGALEKLAHADPGFAQAATKLGIVPSGPAGLACLLSFSRQEIDLARQADNQERIVELAQGLLDSISVAVGHMEKVGRGLKSATEGFAGLAKSVNARLLPRARNLSELGVRPDNNKPLPDNLPTYQLVALQSAETINGEAEEIAPARLPGTGAGSGSGSGSGAGGA